MKRILSIILASVMLFGCLVTGVSAEDIYLNLPPVNQTITLCEEEAKKAACCDLTECAMGNGGSL